MSIEILFLIVLIFLNAFFAASEIALISLNDNKVKMMAESGDKKAILLQSLLSEPSKFLATIQVGITLAGFLASAFAAGSFAGQLAAFLHEVGAPISVDVLETISVVIITLILSYFTLVFGELVPKRIAMNKAEPIAMFVVRPLHILAKMTAPFVKLLTLSTNGLVRLFGIDPNMNESEVTEEEIRMMVDVGEERGAIQDAEKQMINNIFDFDNTLVSNIMIHRTNITAISIGSTLDDIVEFVKREKYTRYPVFEESIDNIIGILNVKDLFSFIEQGKMADFEMKQILRSPYFVPDSRMADDLFHDMQKNKRHIAIVIDEYGGTAGIITLEDLLEEIVGNIFDEHDEEEFEYKQIDDNTFIFSGMMNLVDVSKVVDEVFPTDDFDTLSGFIIGQLGYVLNDGMGTSRTVTYNNLELTVLEADEKKINRVKLQRVL
ncbi:hemolysin family protein [Radiobacillus deserti]|uniref:HlyC/CorC family transporter n=1 Tax=Radiobacillus deserti TaxID=2594883 RepID=A0A516KDB4_9BACI|nr:hemolysin family protein [Radiobacillus deserti]QDP39360.1 HlyC/CorC family transporter [Radiobacillus deserti]